MKNLLMACFACIFSINLSAQTVSVSNGYGSGNYNAGDTVHIWSLAFDSTKVFVNWTGDTAGIANRGEWHTSFIMPNHNVAIAANLRTVSGNQIILQKIRGKNNLKNVYSCFPPGIKGVIYCLHGTEGSASGWITKVENRQFINAALADSFGIIVTEAEEITLNSDLNGDGKLRWYVAPLDSVSNIDYANMKAITDTFILRGKFSRATPRYSFGMSDGGAFSSSLSYVFRFRAGISYCASGSSALFNSTTIPTQFCMAGFDNNASVGPAGNAEALDNFNTLKARSICAGYYLHDRSPCYPQRFARVKGISFASSQNIYNDLLSHGLINNRHFFSFPADTIAARISANPTGYPSIFVLTPTQRADILMQIGVMNAEHNFYSDLNRTSLNFFKNPCNSFTAAISANGSSIICAGGSVLLTANNGNGYTFQWLKDGIVINNATMQTYAANATGSYAVRLTAPGNIVAISNNIVVTINAAPAPQISPVTANICPGSTLTLSTTIPFTSYAWSTGANAQSIAVAAPGTYSVTVTNPSGCSGSTSATVAGLTCVAPANLFTSSLTRAAVTLNWNAAPCAYSYKLQYRKAGTANWTNLTMYAPATSKTITGLSGGSSYQWRLRTQCSSSTGNQSSFTNIQLFSTIEARIPVTGKQSATATDVRIYPNPATENFTIELPQQRMNVAVKNLSGIIMSQAKNIWGKTIIDCSDFPAGMYLVTGTVNDVSFFVQKIIVIK